MKTLIPVLFNSLLLNLLGLSALIPGLYKSVPGPFHIATVKTFVLHDAKRDKDLPLRITYPDSGSGFPVIIWSHGALGDKDGYQPLIKHWASHGYVCIQPTHEDSRKLLGWGALFNRKKIWRKWSTRPPDISLIIDSLAVIEKRAPGLQGKMDTTRVGVGGHSFGAHTAQLIGGAKPKKFGRGKKYDFSDARPLAILLISPQGSGDGFTRDSWHGLTRPTMVITGTNDTSPRNGKSYKWRTEVYRYAPAGDKYLVVINDAYHGFGGIAGPVRFKGSGPTNPQQVTYVKSASTAFWDAYLQNRVSAHLYLQGRALSRASNGEIEVKSK
ncbi:MAG: alpha/beta hydrolase family protein [bacterium]